MDDLAGKRVLITGGAVRIGKEITTLLAEKGMEVVIHYNNSATEAARLQEQLKGKGAECRKIKANFEQTEQVSSLIGKVERRIGRLDCLINNASIFPPDGLKEVEFADLRKNLMINTWAPFELSRNFAGKFPSGKIVNILDTRIAGYDWDHIGYILSKKALAQLTRMMALRYSPEFSVNGISPGVILPPEGADESFFEELSDRIPLGKRGRPSEIARTVLFLLESEFITGEIITVDGGRHLLREKDSF